MMLPTSSSDAPRWLYAAGLLLLGFYAWVSWCALNPNVSPQYRSYFLDKTSNCWVQKNKPRLSLGAQMPFGYGKPAHGCSVLKEGWDTSVVNWGTWSTEPAATLSLSLLSDAHRKASLRFFVLGFDPLGLQDISIFLEDQFSAEWHPAHEKIVHYDMEVDLTGAQNTVEVNFLFSDPLSLTWLNKASNNTDHRLIGMGLLGVDWVTP